MRRGSLLSGVACGLLLLCLHAHAEQTTEDGYQTATVINVNKHVSASNYVGDNPIDAPLQARVYSYDIGIRLNCKVYVGRYESATRYLPPAFAPDHEIDVRLDKHVMYFSLPFRDGELMMGIVSHGRVKNEMCTAIAPKAFQPSRLGL